MPKFDPYYCSRTGARAEPRVAIKVNVEPEVRDGLARLATRKTITLSEAVRQALRAAVKAEPEEPSTPVRGAASGGPCALHSRAGVADASA